MERHKDKANRNLELSERLYQEKDFLDWSCITAFYSALHWVYCKILPQEYNGKMCNNIEEAMIALKAKNKHKATSYMVRVKYPKVSVDYDYLKTLSYTARYLTEEVDIHTAKFCQKCLKNIKEEILK